MSDTGSSTLIHRWVQDARNAINPRVIARLSSGWAVMGEAQVTRGYCLLLPDPVVPHLNGFASHSVRHQFLNDMACLGDIVLEVTGALRINYEMLGNVEPALHAHVFPRYNDEPDELRTKPIWFYDWTQAPKYSDEVYGQLKQQILAGLKKRGLV